LVESCLGGAVALGRHEHLNVDGVREIVTSSDELCFGGALGVNALLFEFANDSTAAERNDAAGVAAHIVMHCERGADPSGELVE
jgi:hypothetical protein